MGDWEQFIDEVSWFLAPGEMAEVADAQPWTRGRITGLPALTDLLGTSTVTGVSVGGRSYELLAWGPPDARRGWLCHTPVPPIESQVHSTQQDFWAVCGGIVERFNEPESWWNNQNEVLTEDAAGVALAPILADYSWIWRDSGMSIPIDPAEYYPVAVEANGNLTLVHRVDGRLLLFAPDHAFTGVTPVPGCPPYSLMTIDNAPDLASWIETCAAAWTDGGRSGSRSG